jgi:hypothetical protein
MTDSYVSLTWQQCGIAVCLAIAIIAAAAVLYDCLRVARVCRRMDRAAYGVRFITSPRVSRAWIRAWRER